MGKKGILVVGSANVDLVVSSERFPNPGETIFGKSFEMFPGGKGANQAVSCAKLGGETYFLGKMGNDDFYRIINKSLIESNVNIDDSLVENDAKTGVALISVDGTGENQIIVISGSNMQFSPDDLTLKKKIFSEVKVVLTQLEIPIDTVTLAARLAKQNNTTFILNPAPAADLSNDLLSMVDYITPNETELEMLSGIKVTDKNSAEKGAGILLERGVKNVIVTLGAQGALLVNNERSSLFDSYNVEVIDTTAAGDSFNGALAFSLSENLAIDNAIHFANYSAALSVTKMGAQTSMPSYDEVMTIL